MKCNEQPSTESWTRRITKPVKDIIETTKKS